MKPSYPASPFSCLVLSAFHSGLSVVTITSKRDALLQTDTMGHNGPLFWLDVVERSLVKNISSTIMSRTDISIPCYLLQSFCPASLLLLFIYYFSFRLEVDSLPRLVVAKKTRFFVFWYFRTKRIVLRPSVVFLFAPLMCVVLFVEAFLSNFALCVFLMLMQIRKVTLAFRKHRGCSRPKIKLEMSESFLRANELQQ